MSPKSLIRPLVLLIPLLSLAACTGMRGPDGTTPTYAPPVADTTDTAVAPPAASSNPAVIALLDNARAEASAGRLPTATAAVERALRIEPRNPVLWQELAMLKLQKGDYQQAETFALRSNSWAGSNKPLLAKNWRIISEARALRGDNEGAKTALSRANALEPVSEPE